MIEVSIFRFIKPTAGQNSFNVARRILAIRPAAPAKTPMRMITGYYIHHHPRTGKVGVAIS